MDDTSKNFSAKKSLGQNFLHAPQVISSMVHAGKVEPMSVVLEIGPGKGALTSKLLDTGAYIIAFEKDDRAIPFLQEKFSIPIRAEQLELVHGDILDLDIEKHPDLGRGYSVIANIPYYITGELIRKFLESSLPPERMVIMVQKEVARRITDAKESILSLSVKAYGKPSYVCSVPRKFFRPMPNVDSAVLLIENISKSFFIESRIEEKRFFEVIKAGFAHKRKVLIRNLEEVMPKTTLEAVWEKHALPRDIRAENVSLEMWKKIVGYH